MRRTPLRAGLGRYVEMSDGDYTGLELYTDTLDQPNLQEELLLVLQVPDPGASGSGVLESRAVKGHLKADLEGAVVRVGAALDLNPAAV